MPAGPGAGTPSYHFLVSRGELSECRIEPAETPALAPGESLLRVDRFALTANNVTYAVAADLLGYWKFFPAPGGWGRIPVWGIATVVASRVDGLAEGSRFFGYLPMSGHVVVQPGGVRHGGFVDDASHRRELPAVYNHYAAMTSANGFPPGSDDHQAVYRPLFTTAFVLADLFADNSFFGAGQVVLSSASSKTAIGTAYLMQNRAPRLVGLTSPANRAFVEGLRLYDDVFGYDELERLNAALPTAYVDFSGNRSALAAIHHRLRDRLVNSCSVGITHRDARAGEAPANLPGARPALFFAPTQIRKRSDEWGPAEFRRRLGAAWQAFLGVVDDWVDIVVAETPARLEETYRTVLAGAAPDRACVLFYREPGRVD